MRILILILRLVFWNFKPKSIFGQIWVKKFEFSTLPGSWYTKYLENKIVTMQIKVWKKTWKWITVLSACCCYIFIAAESKNWINQQKNVGKMRLLLQWKSFLSKFFCFNQNFETKSRLHIDFYIMGHPLNMYKIISMYTEILF